MEISRAKEENIDILTDFWTTLAKGMEQYSDLNELSEDRNPEEGFRKLLDDEEAEVHLAEEDDEKVGFIVLREGEHSSREYSDYLEIVDLFVAEEFRNQGIGSELLDFAEQRAKEMDKDVLKISAEVGNKGARRLYTKAGFEEKQIQFSKKI